MKKTKIIALIVSVIMVFALFTGCAEPTTPAPGESSAASDDGTAAESGATYGPKIDGEIAYVAYFTGIPYWNDGLRGLEAAAKQLGIDFDRNKNFYGPQDGSGQEQARIIDELVAKGVKGLIISPADNDSIVGACQNAMDQGIPVILVISGISDKNAYYGSIGASNTTVGLTGGEYIAEAIGGEGKVGMLTIPGVPVHDERAAGYAEKLKEYPGIELIEPYISTEAGADVALQRAQALIQSNPDIKALIATDSTGGAAAARAVKEAGKEGEIKIIGMDRDADLLGYIQEGVVTATVASKSYSSKYLAMHYMYWILTDSIHDVSDSVTNQECGINPMPVMIDTDVMVIDQSNVQSFLDAVETE